MVMLEELFMGDALPYAASFLFMFAVMFFVLKKGVFGENRGASVVIAGSVSALSVWGLVNYTDYMGSISELFGNFSDSLRMLIFVAVIVLFLVLLYIGFKQGLKRVDISWTGLIVLLASVFAFFLPELVSIYSLPEIFQNDVFRWAVLIVGGGTGLVLIAKKYRYLKLIKTNSAGIKEWG